MNTFIAELSCWTCGLQIHNEIRGGIRGVYSRGTAYQIVACAKCGILTTYPRPSEGFLSELYESEYAYDYHKANRLEKSLRASGVIAFLKSTSDLKESKCFLELGSASGALSTKLNLLYGLSGVGTDLAADEARSTETLEFRNESIEDYLSKEKRQFDYVIVSHTLEHVLNPVDILKRIQGVMHSSSKLILVVPNTTSRRSNSWGYWQVPIHITHFNRDSLKGILKSTGYVVEKVGFRTIDVLGMGLTIMNKLNIRSAPRTNRGISLLLPLLGFIWHAAYRIGNSDLLIIARKTDFKVQIEE